MTPILRYAAAAILAIALCACSENPITDMPGQGPDAPGQGVEPDQLGTFTLSAGFEADEQDPKGADTRVSMDDDDLKTIKTTWILGDCIYVTVKGDATRKAYKFIATELSADAKSAKFTSTVGYPDDAEPEYAIHQGTATFTTFDPEAFKPEGGCQLCTEAQLPQRHPLYAKYDKTQGIRLRFKPLLTVLKFSFTLPDDAQTTIPTGEMLFRMQNAETAFYPEATVNLTGAAPVTTLGTGVVEIANTNELTLDAAYKTVVYLPVPAYDLAGKKFDIRINGEYYATLKGGLMNPGKCMPLARPADKWTELPYAAGTGTEADPFTVVSAVNLRAMAKAVEAATTYSGNFFRMENDIIIDVTKERNKEWLPIGWRRTYFRAAFDGNNKTISISGGPLTIKTVTDTYNGPTIGIFGMIVSPSFKDLTVNGDITYTGVALHFGSIIGAVGTTAITNCHHIGSVSYQGAPTTYISIGGIVGYSNSLIEGCTQKDGTIKSEASPGYDMIGGINGFHTGAIHASSVSNTSLVSSKLTKSLTGAINGNKTGQIYTCNKWENVTSNLQNPITAGPENYPTTLCLDHGGTVADPHHIYEQKNLEELAAIVNDGTNNCAGKYFRLENDITITTTAAAPWVPIGTYSNVFQGNFNGNKKTITAGDFYIKEIAPENSGAFGLFGATNNGNFQDINLNGNIIVDAKISSKNLQVGSICGYVKGKISGCTHNGTVTVTSIASDWTAIGGILGASVTGTAANYSEVENCTHTGDITHTWSGPVKTRGIGGITGYMNPYSRMHTCWVANTTISAVSAVDASSLGALAGWIAKPENTFIHRCSTFDPTTVKLIEVGTLKTTVKTNSHNTLWDIDCDSGH